MCQINGFLIFTADNFSQSIPPILFLMTRDNDFIKGVLPSGSPMIERRHSQLHHFNYWRKQLNPDATV